MDAGSGALTVGAALWSVAVTLEIVIRITMIGIVPGNRRPTTAMAWLLAIFFLPVVGLLLYLLFANIKLSRRRTLRQKRVNDSILETTQHMAADQAVPDAPDWVLSAVALNKALGALPLQKGNAVEFITGYAESFVQMRHEIDRAQRYIHVQFYIMGDDETYVGPILEALERAVDRGVKVRVLFDHLGTIRVKGYLALTRRMTDAGIHWRRMLPLAPFQRQWRRPDLRNHRKIVVVDGHVAFTGSQNLIEPGYKRASSRKSGRAWVELMAKVRGPLVTSLDVVFATDWSQEQESDEDLMRDLADVETIIRETPDAGEAIGQLVPSGPGFETENNLRLFNTLIYSATERLSITSPYFVPDDSLLYAITTAAQRGVAVELFVCEKGDQFLVHRAQQSYYEVLLKAGVRIYRYRAPDVLHSKCFTVDDEVAVFGSSNMDIRSFSLNLEITLMLLGPDMVAELMRVQDSYRAESVELTLGEWKSRKPLSRWIDNVARLSATLQ
ncbi:cardiolipin synthase [Paeniglutamicibacter kerguelensis]|uniref:Cardiolipin synthase n=1 Tax=Paeniglutamicibacter kerguelensis TaxID=254788 RepID=A0ABS4XFF5_9MICC|nr:cardiolipin synthase [Paeniglutamicibacter kerguelensis]MBP2387187.1 cardiolipin synthase [Paeniglutamicibacter kerguelensis]